VAEKPDGWEKKGPGPVNWGTRFNQKGSDHNYLHIGDILYDEQFRAFQRENTLDFVKFKQTGEADFHARSGKSRLALYKCKWGRDPEDPQNDGKRKCPFTSYLGLFSCFSFSHFWATIKS
jgi:hypothetical protein